ncbi:hypothetical protein Taro_049901 [Colocasia esculenta]|uniref:Uncharacterized protein n=1 Tax=Colocasia esculenta TaxID=4460 RepID=A0A843XC29_COLES|nr:hypothetical protein [Colocasia esculenta]
MHTFIGLFDLGQPVLFLTASLLAAPEPLREVRRGTVVQPDYGGYSVYFVSYLALTRREGETSQQWQGAHRAEETGRSVGGDCERQVLGVG